MRVQQESGGTSARLRNCSQILRNAKTAATKDHAQRICELDVKKKKKKRKTQKKKKKTKKNKKKQKTNNTHKKKKKKKKSRSTSKPEWPRITAKKRLMSELNGKPYVGVRC